MKQFTVKKLASSAMVAAAYAALTLILFPISYGNIQFRLSEALCLLPYSYRNSVWGLFIGCVIANLLNPAGVNALDVVFGSAATLIAGLMTARIRRKALAPLPMAIVNGVVVGAVLAFTATPDNFFASFWIFALEVAAGELVVGYVVGLPLLKLFEKLRPKLKLEE